LNQPESLDAMSVQDAVFDRPEAAAFLKISVRYLSTLTKKNLIKSFRIGSRRMYLKSELIRYAHALMEYPA